MATSNLVMWLRSTRIGTAIEDWLWDYHNISKPRRRGFVRCWKGAGR